MSDPLTDFKTEVYETFATKKEVQEVRKDVGFLKTTSVSQGTEQAVLGKMVDNQTDKLTEIAGDVRWFTRSFIGMFLTLIAGVIVAWVTTR